MTDPLIKLFSDFRLYDLFGNEQNLITIQAWVLEIEREGGKELKFLYGRVLPGTYQSNSWSGTTSSKTRLYEKCFAKTHALTLHTSTKLLKIFLKHFISGTSLQAASQIAGLKLGEKLNGNVGPVTFGSNPITRPVMHLPTRDYYQSQTNRLSPTSYASVDSGAISPSNKPTLFCVPEGCDRQIAEAACLALDADTGLDFSALDAWRIGDFEFICAPGLTTSERSKFDIRLKGEFSSLTLYESLTKEPTELLVVVTAYSDDSVQASYVTRLDKHTSYPLDHQFSLEEFKDQASTAFTLEIYALGTSGESFLQLKTGGHFFRCMNLNMQVAEPIQSNVPLGWLEKRVSPKNKATLAAASRVGRSVKSWRSEVGEHTADTWVRLNQLTEDTVKQLCPKASSGRFFLTLTDSGGKSRLLLTEWLRGIFESHHDAQIAWIDPFMEDVGIELLNRMGTEMGNYLIITTEKESKKPSNRMQRLLSTCNEWGNGYFGNVCLKVLAVPEQKIHDRMILIRSANGRPVEGYHLSNSIQRANDNHPLLATPIPLDVMQDVFEYTDQIIQSTYHGYGNKVANAKLIFDSSTVISNNQDEPKGLNHPSSFVDAPRAGDVLSWWLDDSELIGLSGAELMGRMEANGSILDGKLNPGLFDSIPSKFWIEGFPLEDFYSAWDALGYVLAHSRSGELYTKNKKSLPEALKSALLEHLAPSRSDALQPRIKKQQLDIEYYRSQDLDTLLLSSGEPDHVFSYSPPDTSWSDYYALNLLWSREPEELVNWLSTICSQPIKGVRTHALVVEAFKHICLSLGFDKHVDQIDALLQSKASIVTWTGLHAFQRAINSGTWGVDTLSKIDQVDSPSNQRTLLCWLINEANYADSDAKRYLIAKLTQSIEAPLTDQELQELLQPVRGRLGRLHHFTPWILESLLVPMLAQRSIDTAQVSRKWLAELSTQWKAALAKENVHFKLEADGAFTDELATLTAYLSAADQKIIFEELWSIFRSLARTIRQPFSAQASWRSYSKAHEVNLWLYALARRIAALIHDEEKQPLNDLLVESELIIERLSPSNRERFMSRELLTYVKGDPAQIRSNRLHHTIQRAIAYNQ